MDAVAALPSARPVRVLATGSRLLLGLVTLAAIALEIARGGSPPHVDVADLLSFFTVQSNALAAAVLLLAAVRPAGWGAGFDRLRGAAVVYMVVTGAVYAALLSGGPAVLLPWVTVLLHRVMPIAVVGDWLLFPPVHRLDARRALVWLGFPLAYLGYTLIRGAIVGWYPYPFLDPHSAGGPAAVARFAVVLALAIAALAWAVVWAGDRAAGARRGRAASAPDPAG